MKLTKNGVVCTQKKKNRDFRYRRKFRYIAKFPTSSEILGVAKFSLSYSEISLLAPRSISSLLA